MCRAAQSEPGRVRARTKAAYPWSSEGAGEGVKHAAYPATASTVKRIEWHV